MNLRVVPLAPCALAAALSLLAPGPALAAQPAEKPLAARAQALQGSRAALTSAPDPKLLQKAGGLAPLPAAKGLAAAPPPASLVKALDTATPAAAVKGVDAGSLGRANRLSAAPDARTQARIIKAGSAKKR